MKGNASKTFTGFRNTLVPIPYVSHLDPQWKSRLYTGLNRIGTGPEPGQETFVSCPGLSNNVGDTGQKL